MEDKIKIIQIAHGRIIPSYYSAYSMRCYSILDGTDRKIISVGGPVLWDKKTDTAEQYRSYLNLILSILKGNRSFEILLSQGRYLRKKFLNRIEEVMGERNVVVYEGPWLYNVTKKFTENKIVIYDAHNVEFLLRDKNIYRERVKEIEGELVNRADIIFTVTKEDMESFMKIYGVEESRIFHVPHQLKVSEYRWNGKNSNDIVFIGSLYEPNIIALKEIEKIAKDLPDFNFHIIGSLNRYPGRKRMKNIIYHGTVGEPEKESILNRAFLALNPVKTGSGRNVKMVDYMAHGIPILTTEVGARGFSMEEVRGILFIEDVNNFGRRILEISKDRESLDNISRKIYSYYVELYRRETSIRAIDIIENYIKNNNK